MDNINGFLFVGGPVDGQRLLLPEGHRVWRVPERMQHDLTYSESHDYRQEKIQGQRERFIVYVSVTLSIDEALNLIFDGYKVTP